MALSLFNCFSVPIEVAFESDFLQDRLFYVLNFIIDFIFFLDICVAFRTVYIDDLGNEETCIKKIAWQYIKTTFIIDFLATVPWGELLLIFPSYRVHMNNTKDSGSNLWI